MFTFLIARKTKHFLALPSSAKACQHCNSAFQSAKLAFEELLVTWNSSVGGLIMISELIFVFLCIRIRFRES